MTQIPAWFFYLFALLFGACVGSFANVCIVRVPIRKSIVTPRSACPSCNHRLSWWENIPILSFMMLKGRCNKCKKRISLQYPLVEFISIILSVLLWWHFNELSKYFSYYLLLVTPLLIISVIDLHLKIIPDVISLPGILAGLGVRLILSHPALRLHNFFDSLIGIAVGAGFLFMVAFGYEKLKKREGLGGGDVKLAAMLGAFFGWQAIIFILLLSSLIGLVAGLILILAFKRDRYFEIPFGPFLSLSALIFLLLGNRLIQWYLAVF